MAMLVSAISTVILITITIIIVVLGWHGIIITIIIIIIIIMRHRWLEDGGYGSEFRLSGLRVRVNPPKRQHTLLL